MFPEKCADVLKELAKQVELHPTEFDEPAHRGITEQSSWCQIFHILDFLPCEEEPFHYFPFFHQLFVFFLQFFFFSLQTVITFLSPNKSL